MVWIYCLACEDEGKEECFTREGIEAHLRDYHKVSVGKYSIIQELRLVSGGRVHGAKTYSYSGIRIHEEYNHRRLPYMD